MLKLIIIAFRNLGRHKKRTFFCISAVFFAVAFSTLSTSFFEGMTSSIADSIRNMSMGDIKIISNDFKKKEKYLPLFYPIEGAGNIIEKVKGIVGVKAVFPRIRTYGTLTDNDVRNVFVLGLKYDEESKIINYNMKNKNNGIKEGRPPVTGANECIIGYKLAKRLKINIGDDLTFKFTSSLLSDKFMSPKVVGFTDFDSSFYDRNFVIMSYEKLAKSANFSDQAQMLTVFIENPDKIDHIKQEIDNILKDSPNVSIKWTSSSDAIDYNINKIAYKIVNLILLIVACFLIINTISISIIERTKEIGMLGSLGLKAQELLFLFLTEGFLIGFIGSALGVLLSGFLCFNLSLNPISLLPDNMDKELPYSMTMYFNFGFNLIFYNLLIGVVISTICTLLSAFKTVFIEPVEALRG